MMAKALSVTKSWPGLPILQAWCVVSIGTRNSLTPDEYEMLCFYGNFLFWLWKFSLLALFQVISGLFLLQYERPNNKDFYCFLNCISLRFFLSFFPLIVIECENDLDTITCNWNLKIWSIIFLSLITCKIKRSWLR